MRFSIILMANFLAYFALTIVMAALVCVPIRAFFRPLVAIGAMCFCSLLLAGNLASDRSDISPALKVFLPRSRIQMLRIDTSSMDTRDATWAVFRMAQMVKIFPFGNRTDEGHIGQSVGKLGDVVLSNGTHDRHAGISLVVNLGSPSPAPANGVNFDEPLDAISDILSWPADFTDWYSGFGHCDPPKIMMTAAQRCRAVAASLHHSAEVSA